ncbi:zinc finger protein with KRAB and SCAN domains 1-like [Onychostruthus taczanowskii]|uniref:zinc finger protein with KRAB and SCAN domains 1-like n=1 Tax=Onychostruthus taczanowskii TaxID=356909 RepID=UPI001B8083C0|nr:zinc finger protein with KRAB and SCAN domains 1-like [Onychostruthus taczanowskii]
MKRVVVRKRKMPQDTQADRDLRMETREDKSPRQNLMEEAVLSSSAVQESNREENAQRSPTRRACKPIPGCSKEERPTLSEEGGQSFSQSLGLVVSEQLSDGEKPHKCGECGKGCSCRSNLFTHCVHSGECPYECWECRMSFRWRSDLIPNQMIHTGERPYECGKSFSQRTQVIIHQRIHTWEAHVHFCMVGQIYQSLDGINPKYVDLKRFER